MIEDTEDGLVFRDKMFKGTCDLFDDGEVILKRKEVIAEGAMKSLAELTMDQVPLVFYTLYNDYLISNTAMDVSIIKGDLPAGKQTNCILSLQHITLKNYRLTFAENGVCKMECTGVGSEKYYYEGSYECDGKMVLLTFTEGTMDGEAMTGKSEMALYIDDGKVYDSIYKKV